MEKTPEQVAAAYKEFGPSRLEIPKDSTPIEANPYNEEIASTYEESKGFPITAEVLGLKENFKVNPHVEMQVRAVDEYIRGVMEKEGGRDTRAGYMTVFNRLIAESNSSRNPSNNKSVLENLFMRAALSKGMSSKTYQKEYTQNYQMQRVQGLLSQLGDVLLTLKK